MQRGRRIEPRRPAERGGLRARSWGSGLGRAVVVLGLIGSLGCGGEASAGRSHGVILELHPESAEVVIDHEEIPGLMGAMTMTFTVADAAMLERLETGQGVDFAVSYADGRYTITEITPSASDGG